MEVDIAVSFESMGLEPRLLKSIFKLGWVSPTPVQSQGIPLALEGSDVLTKAKTGSGKTAVYLIPIIQRILTRVTQGIRAVVVVPSKELSRQVCLQAKELSYACSREVKALDLIANGSKEQVQFHEPNIIVGTPSKLSSLLRSEAINLTSLECLVIDEADLIFSFGYEKDFRSVVTHLPKIYQCFLMSATFSADVKMMKKLVLHNPVTLELKDTDLPEETRLTQSYIRAEREDKFLLIYALLKLNLLEGKSLIFVNTIDSCYTLKLFLEKFSIRSCVLNSELPQNSRLHIIEEFNKDVYEIIIATDESVSVSNPTTDKQSKKFRKDAEFSVARGVDFQNIKNVINFDFPTTAEKYIHRIGRTARGTSSGTALSLVSSKEENYLQQLEDKLSKNGEVVLKSYQFKMSEIDTFRYRVNGVMKSITKLAIRNARVKEIKTEIFNSTKLQTYFEENPRDLEVLRHDKHLQPKQIEPSMRYIPPYLVPKSMKATFSNSRSRKKHNPRPMKARSTKLKRARHNPLKSLSLHKPTARKRK